MNDQERAAFGKELNKGVGELLSSFRSKAGLSMEQVAEAIALKRLERIRGLEAGDVSLRGEDLMELTSVYGVNPAEFQAEIQLIAAKARAKYPPPSAPVPGAAARTEVMPQSSPPNAP